MRKSLLACLWLCSLLTLASCETMESVTTIGTVIGQGAGVITGYPGGFHPENSQSRFAERRGIHTGTGVLYRTGRRSGRPWEISGIRSRRGQRVCEYRRPDPTQASDLPAIFGGYHFLVLNSNDINAFATPSGLVFVTRGLLRCCRDEDALAAVLAHEIGHIQLRHGMQAIEKARVTEALTTIASEGARTFGPREVAALRRPSAVRFPISPAR